MSDRKRGSGRKRPAGSQRPAEKRRAFEMQLDIDASPEAVWKALTEAEELVRWFPLQARVKPGKGGTMFWAWGEKWPWQTRIEAWEPPRLLRLVEEESRGYDAEGRPLPPGKAGPTAIAIEFTLESRQGKTRLRMVHSGFGRGAGWDDEFDSISTGWQFELRSLRHYLERHLGRERRVGWVHLTTPLSREEAWARLLSPDAFPIQAGQLETGRPYEVKAATGERYSGTVVLHLPQRQFAGTVRDLGDGILRLHTHRSEGRTSVHVWLAAYTEDAARVAAFQRRAHEVLSRLFPAP